MTREICSPVEGFHEHLPLFRQANIIFDSQINCNGIIVFFQNRIDISIIFFAGFLTLGMDYLAKSQQEDPF
jgi:hypothetical protein